MKYDELIEAIESQKQMNEMLWKQTHIMFIPSSHKFVNDDGKEKLVKYGINEIWNDFVFKENKILFFINKYLETFNRALKNYCIKFEEDNISFSPIDLFEEMAYYFDSVISAVSVIVEAEQKTVLAKNLDSIKINKFYPTRQKFGLWWQIYMLRNRILHNTEARYDNSKDRCSRYADFSSKILMIRKKNNIFEINSTLIDINKDANIEKAIDFAINNRDVNPFDLLFPNKSAKGQGKKNPNVLYISNDIYFDYATSGVKLINDIHDLLNKINYEFIKKFAEDYDNIEELLNSKTFLTSEEDAYSVESVFKNLT